MIPGDVGTNNRGFFEDGQDSGNKTALLEIHVSVEISPESIP